MDVVYTCSPNGNQTALSQFAMERNLNYTQPSQNTQQLNYGVKDATSYSDWIKFMPQFYNG